MEAGEFRRTFASFQKARAAVVGVTKGPQEKSDRFRESLDLPYPLVGDADGSIVKAYKVRWPLIGLARRTTYVIGRDRTIRLAYNDETNMTAHAARALAAVSGS